MKTKKNIIQKSIDFFSAALKERTNHSRYRLVEIKQDKHGIYIATIQLAQKNQIIKMRPEEILASDDMTLGFSPLDVRTLTYLGYLGINAPKYKVLAKHMSQIDDRMHFALQKKGSNKVEYKTASEISSDKALLEDLDRLDIHSIASAATEEKFLQDEKQRKTLLKSIEKKNNN